MRYAMFAGTLLLCMALSGCGMQSGSTVVKYEDGKETTMTTAPEDAMYSLYSSTDMTPKVTATLKAGDQIGFKSENGKVYAVAGKITSYEIGKGMAPNYYWKMQKK